MDIQTKHRVELLNAKCRLVNEVYKIALKMNNGEDVTCCMKGLYLKVRLINRLDCYSFTDNYSCWVDADLKKLYALLK